MKNIQSLKMLKRSAGFALFFLFSIIISQAQNTRVNFVPQAGNSNFPADNMSLSIYPNPAADEAKVAFNSSLNNESFEIRIVNNSGMNLQNVEGTTIQGENTIRIHVGNYPSGIYYVQLITHSGVRETLKFLKLAISE